MKKAYRHDDEIVFYFDAFDNKYVAQGGSSESVKFAAQFFKMLIDLSEQTSSQNKPKIIVFSHSQGALIANLALSRLTPKERQKIHLFTLGGAVLIEPDAAHPESHNYFNASLI